MDFKSSSEKLSVNVFTRVKHSSVNVFKGRNNLYVNFRTHMNKVPNPSEVFQINTVLKELDQLTDELNTYEAWQESVELKPFLLTMDDVSEMKRGVKKYVIEPQLYDHIGLFTRINWLNYFDGTYSDGEARTGTGSDAWLVYKKGLLQALLKVRDNLKTELREYGRYEMDPELEAIINAARARIKNGVKKRRNLLKELRKTKGELSEKPKENLKMRITNKSNILS